MEIVFSLFLLRKNPSEFLVEQRVKRDKQRVKSNKQQAKSKEQRAKSNEQQAKSNKQRAKTNKQCAKSNEQKLTNNEQREKSFISIERKPSETKILTTTQRKTTIEQLKALNIKINKRKPPSRSN